MIIDCRDLHIGPPFSSTIAHKILDFNFHIFDELKRDDAEINHYVLIYRKILYTIIFIWKQYSFFCFQE